MKFRKCGCWYDSFPLLVLKGLSYCVPPLKMIFSFCLSDIVNAHWLTQAMTESKWTCDICLVRNGATDLKCLACEAPKPGAHLQQKVKFEIWFLFKTLAVYCKVIRKLRVC